MSWDKDLSSLLDDILQDKEPEQVEETPPTPEEVASQDREPDGDDGPDVSDGTDAEGFSGGDERMAVTGSPLSSSAARLADLLNDEDEGDEFDENGDLPPVLIEAGTPGYFDSDCEVCGSRQVCDHREDVTSLVTDDVKKAALPPIDTSAWSKEVEEPTAPIPTFTDDDLMESIDIRNFGTLVSLTNRRWHGKIRDRKAAKDAATASGANAESFEARKRLLVGADEKLKAVHKCIDAARQDHYGMTLPWSTVGLNDHGKRSGPRLLPNSRFFDYVAKMGKYKADMESTLQEFVDAYPTLIAIAQQKLGSAFNHSDYPSPEVIEKHFALEFDFDPIPVGSDYQGLQDAQVEKLSNNLKKKTRQKLENALADAWQRVYDDISHAANVLTNPDAMFHYTMIDKLNDHVANLKHLNVVNNAKIEEIRQDIHKAFAAHDVQGIRDDDALRKRLGEEAVAIRTKMEAYANEC